MNVDGGSNSSARVMRLSTAAAFGAFAFAAFGAGDKGWSWDDGRPRGLAAQVDYNALKTTTTDAAPKQQTMTSQNKNRRRPKTTTSDGQNHNIRHRKERALLCRFPGLVHEARGLGTLCAINCRSTQTRDRWEGFYETFWEAHKHPEWTKPRTKYC